MARRAVEQVGKTLARHAIANWEVEVIHVQPETAVIANFDQVVEDFFDVFWFAIRRETHHFVLARIDFEAGETRERRIKQTERMRKFDFFDYFERVVAAKRKTRRRPLAHAVDREHRGILKRRRIKSRHRVRLMVLGEQHFAREVEKLLNLLFGLQFAAEPQRTGGSKRLATARRIGHGGFDDAVEFEQRLVVEHDMVELRGGDAGFGEAVISGVTRQARVVFLARKSFFLGRGDNFAVSN